MPGLDIKPLLDELRARVAEELDYRLEAESQQAFADAYADDPDIFVPQVVRGDGPRAGHRVDGRHPAVPDHLGRRPGAARPGRDPAGPVPDVSGPSRAGLLHADPHPGNFRLLDDGRLGVLDFGAVDRLPGGFPRRRRAAAAVHTRRQHREVERVLREKGSCATG